MMTLPEALNRILEPGTSGSRVTEAFRIPVRGSERRIVVDPHNRRLKLYDLQPEDLDGGALEALHPRRLPDRAGLSKVTVYARAGGDWDRCGFRREGTIQRYFADGTDADLWAGYRDPARAHSGREEEHRRIVAVALTKEAVTPGLPDGYHCRVAGPGDAGALATLLQAVFDEYPSPLDSGTLGRAIEMKTHHFRMIHDPEGRLVAAASAELDFEVRSAEMTDCATLPDQRGKGLMAFLLHSLGEDLPGLHGIRDFYTLARADEIGMNCAFSKLGYTWTGRLVNNCRMPTGWESMNVWCRRAPGDGAPSGIPGS